VIFLWRLRHLRGELLLSAFFISISFPAACQNREVAVIQANQEIGVSFEPSSIAYRELQNGVVEDSEHGWVMGGGSNASLVRARFLWTNFMLGVSYDFNDGSTFHQGLSQTTGVPVQPYMAHFRSNDALFLFGKGFLLSPNLLLAVEPELEYREWLRLYQGHYSVSEDYTFWAPGLAVGCSYSPLHSLVVKIGGGFAYTVSPQVALIGNTMYSIPNVALGLGKRSVWQAQAGVDWAFSRRVRTFVDANFSHFMFGQSAIAYCGNACSHREPSSITDLTKINVGVAWSF
jgi:hypothetical protein